MCWDLLSRAKNIWVCELNDVTQPTQWRKSLSMYVSFFWTQITKRKRVISKKTSSQLNVLNKSFTLVSWWENQPNRRMLITMIRRQYTFWNHHDLSRFFLFKYFRQRRSNIQTKNRNKLPFYFNYQIEVFFIGKYF